MDTIVTVLGIIYGVLLAVATFYSNKVTEVIRIDRLFMQQPTEVTRKINFVIGLFIIGYNVYSLF